VTRIGLALVLASVLAATLGIVLAQLVDNLGVGILAEVLGGDATVFNNRTEFTGASDLAWGGGFVLCLLVGFLALFAYPTQKGQGIPRLILLWMLLHLLRQGMTQAIMLPFAPDSNLGLAYATLEAPPGLDVVIAAGGAVGLLLVALSAAAAFLAYTPHRKLVSNGKRRLTLALWLALIPAAAAVFLAIPFFLPDSESLVIPGLPLTAVMFLATLAAAPGTTTVQGPEDERVTPWPFGLAAFLVVLLIFNLAVLQGGVSVDPRQWG
jgi:hypothetical protein